MTSYPVTPAMVLAEREEMRKAGRLAHTYDVNGYAKIYEGCDCYTCGDALDPTGEKTAARLNAPPPQGGLQAAPSVLPDSFPNPLRHVSTPTHKMNPLYMPIPPMPASPPKLERQRAVCYDENGVDILAPTPKAAAVHTANSKECELITTVILNSQALVDTTRDEMEGLMRQPTFTHEQAMRLARLYARNQALKSVITHFDLRNL